MDNFNRSGNWFLDQLNVFQSANSDDVSVKKNFIVRKEEFELIIDSLMYKSTKDPLQHELVLGRRGSGKSTLLKRIEIEIRENVKLNDSYVAINLAEEQAGIYRLFDLWEEVINELRDIFNKDIPIAEYESFQTNHEYTRYLYEVIHNVCLETNRRIVLLLDNLDRIVENFNDDGSLLRETLINYNDVQIIAGSTRMDEHFWRYDMPFYEFFRTHRLESLSKSEIETLLIHWSESLSIPELTIFVKTNPGKLENIRILTDGLPRTIQFFVQIVLQKKESDTYEYLKKIMDNVTPLYQERLNHLPAQMRKTILEMAFIWEACTTKQLVERIKMESKLISANLTTLVEKGIVDKIETGKKQHLYRISERFFNMWLIITQGNPEQKRKAKWLSVFLESWYDENEFKAMSNYHIDRLKSRLVKGNDVLLFSKALSQSKYITLEERDTIINLTKEASETKTEDKLIMLPELSEIITKNILKHIEEGNYTKAITCINEIENEADGIKFGYLGLCYDKLADYTKAKKYYVKAIEKGYVFANYNLALMYQNCDQFGKAEKYYLKAIEKGIKESLFNLAVLYYKNGKYEEAEKYYQLAINNGHLGALNNLALMYSNHGKYEEAEKYYLSAIEKGMVDSVFNLALLYDIQKKYDEAEKYYLIAIDKGDVESINNLATIYAIQENFQKAEKYFKIAIEKGYKNALNNIGLLFANQGKYTEAEIYYTQAIEKGIIDSFNNLSYLYYQKNLHNAKALEYINKACELEQNPIYKETQMVIEIWNGVFNNIEKRVLEIIKEKHFDNLDDTIIDLLVQQQKNLVLSLFHNPEIGKNLQWKYLALYYVTLIINNHFENNLMLRIPPELQSTIDDVITRIKERQKMYGYI